MKKSQQSKNKEKHFFNKIPFIKLLKKGWDFEKHIKQDLRRFHDERDPKELKRIIPPKSEKFEIHCAWVSEVFTPSNISILLKSLKKMGWDMPESNVGNSTNLADWVKQGRRYWDQSSWINGGIILSQTDRSRFLGSQIRRARLPKGIDYCTLSLQNITSSITIVTMQFIFSDSLANSLNPILKILHKTKIERKSSSRVCFISPTEQKRNLLQQKFIDVHKNLYSWFHKNLPGHFSSSKSDLPTISLVTTRSYKKSDSQKSILKDHYSDLLFNYDTENWTGKEMPEIDFKMQLNKSSLGILFGNFYDLTKQEMRQYGGVNRMGLIHKFDALYMKGATGLWSVHHLLLNLEKQLSGLRDDAISPIKKIKHAVKNLNFLRLQFLSVSKDVRAINYDIENIINFKNRSKSNRLDFVSLKRDKQSFDFFKILRQQDEMRVKALKEQEKQVSELINVSGHLASAVANLKAQRKMLYLTVFIVVLTIFSTFKASAVLNQIFEKIINLIETINY